MKGLGVLVSLKIGMLMATLKLIVPFLSRFKSPTFSPRLFRMFSDSLGVLKILQYYRGNNDPDHNGYTTPCLAALV